MNRDAIEAKFYTVFAAVIKQPLDTLGPQTSRRNLPAWDSLKHMHLMLGLEEEFGIEFDDRELAELFTVSDLVSALRAKVGP